MKLNSIKQQNFNGLNLSKTSEFIAKHPVGIAGLAGASVVAQKIVMSGSETTIGPTMDIGIGKAITKITKETDGRTNESSEKQAIRTFSQSLGGTITGVAIRGACIALATYFCSKAGGVIASTIADKNNSYLKEENAKAWGKSVGGAVAIGVMMFTNFLIDAPLINVINKKVTKIVENFKSKKQDSTKEVK